MREIYQRIPVLEGQKTSNSILNQTPIEAPGSISYALLPPGKCLFELPMGLVAPHQAEI